ncbi:MAG: hypothetical protein AB7F86_13870, partial [Bdellovibrionales bacterium]
DPSFQSQFEKEAELLRGIEVPPTEWGIRSLLLRHRPDGPIELFHRVRDFWRKYFFSSHFLDHDKIYPFANDYVLHLQSLGAEIIYLTGRPREAMLEGTLKALEKWGFPLTKPQNLMMKTTDLESDEHFKTVVLKDLAPKFDRIWFFENEPLIIDEVRAALPEICIVYVDSVHSGKAHPPNDLPRIGMSYDGPWKR